jgi:predicted membrane protein
MERKPLFGVCIGILIFATVILTIEAEIPVWQILLGLIIFWSLTFGFVNFRNAFILLSMTLVLLLTFYFSIKYGWIGIFLGGAVGVGISLLMHFGWIVPHRAFARSEYVKAQDELMKNKG